MTNWLILDLAGLLSAYRNAPEFQERAVQISDALLEFLLDNDLLVDPSVVANFKTSQDVKIWSDDLTELGKKICVGKGNALTRWLNAMSLIERKISTTILTKELSKLTSSA